MNSKNQIKFSLRPFMPGDAFDIAKNINNKKIYRYTLRIPFPYALADARAYLKRLPVKLKKGLVYNRAIIVNGEVVGCVALEEIVKGHQAELGYWLAEKYWGRGIMTNAVKQIIDRGFKTLGLQRIYAYVFLPNQASAKVLLNNGFKKEGLLRKNAFKNGQAIDDYLFAKVK